MKLNFWAISRRTRKRLKVFLLIVSLAGGMLAAAETRYAIFRLYGIDTDPAGILSEQAVWGTIRPQHEKIWMLLWLSKEKYCENIKAYYPVNLRMELSGWGRFRLEVLPLEPAFRMFWGGKFWYVAADGRTWLSSLKENTFISSEKADALPLLSWSTDRATPMDLSGDHGNVFFSSLPLGKVSLWYDNLKALGWSEKVKFIQAGSREGKEVVRLILFDNEGGNGTNIMLLDDPGEWQTAGLAIKKIYPDISKISSNVFIDTTYKGKILVKNKVQ
ncbi:MAG: hypothetical protein GX672_00285 [Synergistaceae bacterium]|nr:hypothetical protein [Synergistaceae bacterium]